MLVIVVRFWLSIWGTIPINGSMQSRIKMTILNFFKKSHILLG
jgi:hypothetical protein